MMTTSDLLFALGGGALIGLSATMLMFFAGRIAGISGILAGLFEAETHTKYWRIAFLLGLVSGGVVLLFQYPQSLQSATDRSMGWLVLAGLLVGYGVRLGGGCTSGHGVCGISRLSPRSLAATVVFMITGIATATIFQLMQGGIS